MLRLTIIGFAAVVLAACEPAKPVAPAPPFAVSDADAQAAIAKGAADAERNSKVTRRPRRFTEDSL